jgi:AraC-like DNA-binding protein
VLRSDCAADLEEWQRLIASSFVPMRVLPHPTADDASTFTGTVTRACLGSVWLSLITSGPHIVRRTDVDVRLHPADFYKISVQLFGVSHLRQDGREALLREGEAAAYDVTRPYELDFPGPSTSVVVQIPRSEFALPKSASTAIAAVRFPVPRGLAWLLEAPFDAGALASLSAGAARQRGLGLIHLLGAEVIGLAQIDSTGTDQAQWADIERYVAAHLSNPELSLEDLARATFLSRRSLQRVFAEEGTTFSAWLRRKRLERAHARLLTAPDPVAVVARECGFSSAQHFSHCFRDRYAVTARELRRSRHLDQA